MEALKELKSGQLNVHRSSSQNSSLGLAEFGLCIVVFFLVLCISSLGFVASVPCGILLLRFRFFGLPRVLWIKLFLRSSTCLTLPMIRCLAPEAFSHWLFLMLVQIPFEKQVASVSLIAQCQKIRCLGPYASFAWHCRCFALQKRGPEILCHDHTLQSVNKELAVSGAKTSERRSLAVSVP